MNYVAGAPTELGDNSWLGRDSLLICFSAFFADLGYQAVTAVFPLFFILELKQPAYFFGLVLALSFGAGSLFSLLGGKIGNKRSKKAVTLVGNSLIPLMCLSGLSNNVFLAGLLFMGGWWARYFRTPPRRAWLVEVSDPVYRSKIFGFLHALDVGGGLLAAIYSVVMVIFFRFSFGYIILLTLVPLFASTMCLVLAGTTPNAKWLEKSFEIEQAKRQAPQAEEEGKKGNGGVISPAITPSSDKEKRNKFLFRALLVSATLFGFSYFNFGYPILTVSESSNVAVYGIVAFGIYLGVSAISGSALGSTKIRPVRAIWSCGYLVAALCSLAIGFSFATHAGLASFYLASAALGFATGSIETFEPVLTSVLVKSKELSGGMGWLSASRAVGLFVANLAIGVLFTFSEFDAYLYAFLTALAAAIILAIAELWTTRSSSKKGF